MTTDEKYEIQGDLEHTFQRLHHGETKDATKGAQPNPSPYACHLEELVVKRIDRTAQELVAVLLPVSPLSAGFIFQGLGFGPTTVHGEDLGFRSIPLCANPKTRKAAAGHFHQIPSTWDFFGHK